VGRRPADPDRRGRVVGVRGPRPDDDVLPTGGNRPGHRSFEAVLDPTTDVSDLDPGVELADAIDVLVYGHFDDAAAGSRHGVSTEAPIELTPEEITLRCRTQFVITKLEPDAYLP
jgi:hypothetical protein